MVFVLLLVLWSPFLTIYHWSRSLAFALAARVFFRLQNFFLSSFFACMQAMTGHIGRVYGYWDWKLGLGSGFLLPSYVFRVCIFCSFDHFPLRLVFILDILVVVSSSLFYFSTFLATWDRRESCSPSLVLSRTSPMYNRSNIATVPTDEGR